MKFFASSYWETEDQMDESTYLLAFSPLRGSGSLPGWILGAQVLCECPDDLPMEEHQAVLPYSSFLDNYPLDISARTPSTPVVTISCHNG